MGDERVLLFLGSALILAAVLGSALDHLLLVHDTHEPIQLQRTAIAFTTPEKKICSRRNYEQGVRGTADHAFAGREFDLGTPFTLQKSRVESKRAA